MKRLAAAGTFALLAGGAVLLLLASVFYSCRGGGKPHDMGTSATESPPSHVSHSAPPRLATRNTPAPDGAFPLRPGSSSRDDLQSRVRRPRQPFDHRSLPVPDASDDFPRGLVFPSLEDAPTHRRRTLAFVTVAVVAGLALVWPVYPSVAGIRPYVLGLPFSLVWVVGWLVVVFVALVLFYRAEEHDADNE